MRRTASPRALVVIASREFETLRSCNVRRGTRCPIGAAKSGQSVPHGFDVRALPRSQALGAALVCARRAVRVLVIDLDRATAGHLAGMLMRTGFAVQVGERRVDESTGRAATDFDVVALGPTGPVAERTALCSALRDGGYDGAIVAICADISDGSTLVEQGADDFLIAPVEELEMAARVRFCRKRRAAGPLMRCGPLELDCLRRSIRLRGRTIRLTSRDCELLACLIEAGGRVVPRARLLEQVWRGRQDRGTNLVEVHLSRLRDKLGEDARLIQTVRGAGYRLRW